jgi:ribosome-interacting GTPase 1
MPANLPPQYYKLEREFKSETDPREKLRLAEELLRIMPKHKGTTKLQGEMKAKISKLRSAAESGGSSHGGHGAEPFSHIDKEGAAQIILVGPPNSGKSSLVDALTHAKPLVADYPFTTREPTAGMTEFETVHFQLIDTPSVSAERMESYLPNLIRAAHLVVVVLDISSPNVEEEFATVRSRLQDKRIKLTSVSVESRDLSGAMLKLSFVAAHKCLDEGAEARLNSFRSAHPDLDTVATSIIDDSSLLKFRSRIFTILGIIRVYTKRIGHDVVLDEPLTLPVGGTIEDAARATHKDFAAKLNFAKVWREGEYEGQRATRNFVLADRDVVEFHL